MSRKSALIFALVGFLWGIPYLFIKVAVDEENGYAPAIVVFGRVLIGAAILIPLAIKDRSIFDAFRGIKYVAFYALLEMVIPWILIGTAEQKISSGLAGLLIASVPIWSNIITYFQGDEDALKANRLFGIGIGFIGVGVMGSSLIKSLLISSVKSDQICISDKSKEKSDEVASTYKVKVKTIVEIGQDCNVIFFC